MLSGGRFIVRGLMPRRVRLGRLVRLWERGALLAVAQCHRLSHRGLPQPPLLLAEFAFAWRTA